MLVTLLSQALEARQLFGFNYNDSPRIVEPHALGLNAKGEMVLRGYQTNGDTPGWKLFVLEKAEVITVLETPSEAPRPGYKAGDKAMVTILSQLPEPVEQAVAA